MKLKMLAWPGIALLLVGNVQFAHWLQIFGYGDSPVNIGGGSIYADAGIRNWWNSTENDTRYAAKSPDKNYLVLHGLVDAQNNPAPSPLNNPGPWLVFITPATPPWTDPVSISFCSDPVVPAGFPLQRSTQYCNGTGRRDDQTVYAQVNGKSRWEKHIEFPRVWRAKTRLHFHTNHCDGYQGPNETTCDEIAAVMVTVTNDSSSPRVNGVSYHCTDEHDCYIQSGK